MIKKGMKLIYAILMCLIIVNTVSISNTKVFARKDQVTIVDGGGGGSSGQSETTDFLGDLNDWKPTLSSEDADFTKKVNHFFKDAVSLVTAVNYFRTIDNAWEQKHGALDDAIALKELYNIILLNYEETIICLKRKMIILTRVSHHLKVPTE